MLRLFGNEVITAHDGVEAIAAAGAFRPEIVLVVGRLVKLRLSPLAGALPHGMS